jgi:hypothetical protein
VIGVLLAAAPPAQQGPEFGGSSPIALVVVLMLAVVLILLIRSMNKHLRKVPKSFEKPSEDNKTDDADSAKPPSS